MTDPEFYRKTSEAAKYLAETHGIPISAHTLRKWRRGAATEARDRGPEWKVDPVTLHTMYAQSKLDLYAEQWRSRLVNMRIKQPAQLVRSAARKRS